MCQVPRTCDKILQQMCQVCKELLCRCSGNILPQTNVRYGSLEGNRKIRYVLLGNCHLRSS